MAPRRQWSLITALLCIAILVAGYMVLVKPQHKKAQGLSAQASQVDSATQLLRVRLTELQAKERNLPSERATLAAVSAKLPASAELPTLTRQLDAVAKRSHIDLVNVAPGAASPVTGTATSAPAATTAPAASAATSTSLPGVEAMPLVLTISGGFYDIETFIGDLENLPRALLVDSFSVAPGAKASGTTQPSIGSGELSVSLQTRVFLTSAPLPGAPVSTVQ